MKPYLYFLFILITLTGCEKIESVEKVEPMSLTLDQAERLSQLPLKCLDQEYPNKLSQTLISDEELDSPQELHPAFFGCFDWHSSVHGHWVLVKMLKTFPDLKNETEIRQRLNNHFAADLIRAELAYFKKEHEKSYERTYGWAWYLKLMEELRTWEDTDAKRWADNLQPLADHFSAKYVEFLPKLNYPLRMGTHRNTGFGLSYAWDYANTVGDSELKNSIEAHAKRLFIEDRNCPLGWEPSGFDFLSPCLEEADIMRRVLPVEEFETWLNDFLPDLKKKDFTWEPAKVSDRSDGHLVHLDGLNFSRAWCLYGIAQTLPEYEHLNNIANEHINFSLPNIVDGDYAGEHWLASFAMYALTMYE